MQIVTGYDIIAKGREWIVLRSISIQHIDPK